MKRRALILEARGAYPGSAGRLFWKRKGEDPPRPSLKGRVASLGFSPSKGELEGVFSCVFFLEGIEGAAVEAVGTDAFLGQSDGLDERLELGEAQGVEVEAAGYLCHHALVLGAVGAGVGLKVFAVVAFKVLDDAAGEELQVALAGAVVDEGTAIDERGTADAHVYLLGAELVQHLRVVAQLCAAHDAVVAEEDALALEHVAVGDELHLGHEVACLLVAGSEGARPGGCVLADGAHVGAAVPLGVADGHAYAAVRDAAGAIDLRLVLFAHHAPAFVAHHLGVAPFVAAGGEAVVNPQEGTYLHAWIGFPEDRHLSGIDADYLARAEVVLCLEAQVGEGGCLAGDGHCAFLLADHDGCAAPRVAGCDDAVLGEQEHGA